MTEKESKTRRRWRGDPGNGYGWMSIILHWVAGCAVIVLLFTGSSVTASPTFLLVHTSVAILLYPLLWGRILWRLAAGHPSVPLSPFSALLAKATHYAMLLCMAVMLLSGPPMAWAGGLPVNMVGFLIPSPIEVNIDLHYILRRIHGFAGAMLAVMITTHVAAVLKHVIINRDTIFDRIMVAAKADEQVQP